VYWHTGTRTLCANCQGWSVRTLDGGGAKCPVCRMALPPAEHAIRGRGDIENEHSTDVETPPSTPRACMRSKVSKNML